MTFFQDGFSSQRTLAGMLLVFALLALSHLWAAGQRVDAWIFLNVNARGGRPPWLDWVMLGLTQLGSTVAVLGVALVFVLADDRALAYRLVLGTLTLWMMVELLKAMVRRARPYIGLAHTRVVGLRVSGLSFPSGHTSQAFLMATLLAQHLKAGAGLNLLLYGLALVVGVTRIYVGAHYPRDVLAGMILGTAWALLASLVPA